MVFSPRNNCFQLCISLCLRGLVVCYGFRSCVTPASNMTVGKKSLPCNHFKGLIWKVKVIKRRASFCRLKYQVVIRFRLQNVACVKNCIFSASFSSCGVHIRVRLVSYFFPHNHKHFYPIPRDIHTEYSK